MSKKSDTSYFGIFIVLIIIAAIIKEYLWVIGLVIFIGGITIAYINKRKGKNPNVAAIIGVCGLVLVGVWINFLKEESPNEIAEDVQQVQQVATNNESPSIKTEQTFSAPVEIKGTLNMTPDEFMKKFNDAADKNQSLLKITNLPVEEGSVQNTFQTMLTENIALIGDVNKADGSVRDVMILGQGNGTAESGLDILISMGTLIVATNPDLTQAERAALLQELGVKKGAELKDLNKQAIRNGIKYSLNYSEQIGITFSAADINDK